MMWEYSHYLLFVQAVSLFLLDSFALAQSEKVLELISLPVAEDWNTASYCSKERTLGADLNVSQPGSSWGACPDHWENVVPLNLF